MSMVSLHDCLRNAAPHFRMIRQIVVVDSAGKERTIGDVASCLKIANGCEWILEFDKFIYTGGKEDEVFTIVPDYINNLSDEDRLNFYTAVIKQWGFWVYRELYEAIKPKLTPEMGAELYIRLGFDEV